MSCTNYGDSLFNTAQQCDGMGGGPYRVKADTQTRNGIYFRAIYHTLFWFDEHLCYNILIYRKLLSINATSNFQLTSAIEAH